MNIRKFAAAFALLFLDSCEGMYHNAVRNQLSSDSASDASGFFSPIHFQTSNRQDFSIDMRINKSPELWMMNFNPDLGQWILRFRQQPATNQMEYRLCCFNCPSRDVQFKLEWKYQDILSRSEVGSAHAEFSKTIFASRAGTAAMVDRQEAAETPRSMPPENVLERLQWEKAHLRTSALRVRPHPKAPSNAYGFNPFTPNAHPEHQLACPKTSIGEGGPEWMSEPIVPIPYFWDGGFEPLLKGSYEFRLLEKRGR